MADAQTDAQRRATCGEWRGEPPPPTPSSPPGPAPARLSGWECIRLGFFAALGFAFAGIVLAAVVGVVSILAGWGVLAWIF